MLIDNGVQFVPLPHRLSQTAHLFDQCCAEYSVECRRTRVAHPWTNGYVERLNCTVKEATMGRCLLLVRYVTAVLRLGSVTINFTQATTAVLATNSRVCGD